MNRVAASPLQVSTELEIYRENQGDTTLVRRTLQIGRAHV